MAIEISQIYDPIKCQCSNVARGVPPFQASDGVDVGECFGPASAFTQRAPIIPTVNKMLIRLAMHAREIVIPASAMHPWSEAPCDAARSVVLAAMQITRRPLALVATILHGPETETEAWVATLPI